MKDDKEIRPPIEDLGGIKEGHFSVPRQMIDETWQPEIEPIDVNKMKKELIKELETWREEIQKDLRGAVNREQIIKVISTHKEIGKDKYDYFFARKEITDAFLDFFIEMYEDLYTCFWEG